MKKRMLALIVIATMLVTMIAGCGSKSSAGKNGELNIFIWTEYVPDSVIQKFEKETGIKVNVLPTLPMKICLQR